MNIAITYLIKDNQILLMYKETRGYFVGPGGKIELDETAKQAAQREFLEETGLTVMPKLFAVSSISTTVGVDGQSKNRLMLSFFATDYTGDLLPETREGVLSWKPIGELTSLPMFSGDKMLVKELIDSLCLGMPIPMRYASFHYDADFKQLLEYDITGEE